MGNHGVELWRGGGGGSEEKRRQTKAEVRSVGTSPNQSDRVTKHGWGFQTKTRTRMSTRPDYSAGAMDAEAHGGCNVLRIII